MKNIVNVDTSVLPRRNNGNISWKDSVGVNVPFQYNDSSLKGEIKIIEYFPKNDKRKIHITIQYQNRKTTISASAFVTGRFPEFINGKKNLYKKNIGRHDFKIGDIVDFGENQKFRILGIKLSTPKNSEKTKRDLWYYVECLDCGYRYWKNDKKFDSKKCLNCTHQVTWEGVNDICTTDPWMVQYFQGGAEEAKKYRSQSNIKINPICPICGKQLQPTVIGDIYQHHGVCCPNCSDGVSYPEKFFQSFLDQLKCPYIRQASTRHLGFNTYGKVYDFYLSNIKTIIETHGPQHYEESLLLKLAGKTLQDEQNNDLLKQQLAENNGYKYIIVDCRISSVDWIKKSIKNSILPSLLNFKTSDIDWNKCGIDASKSMKRVIWDYYNKFYYSVKELVIITKLSKTTINRYLIEGNELGMCRYDPYLEQYSHPIQAIKDNKIILEAKSINEMADKYNEYFGLSICSGTIDHYLNNRTKNPNNIIFERITDKERRRKILYGDTQ